MIGFPQRQRSCLWGLLFLLSWAMLSPLAGQTAPIRAAVREITEYLSSAGGRSLGRETTEELAKLGGEQAVRQLAERALREGGEETLQQLVRLTRNHGVETLRMAENASSLPRLLRVVDDLPPEMAGSAIRRLASPGGRNLAEMVERGGESILRGELAHPGLGGRLVHQLGPESGPLVSRLSREQALLLGGQAEHLALAAPSTRAAVMRLFTDRTDASFRFLGDFIQRNPGKVLFTAAGTTLFLAHHEALLGGAGEIVYDADGNPIFVAQAGFFDRLVGNELRSVIRWLGFVLVSGLALYLGLKLLLVWRRGKARS